MDVPFERFFYGFSGIWFPGKRNKDRVLANDFIDDQGSEDVLGFSRVACFRSLFFSARRNRDRHVFDERGGDVARQAKDSERTEFKRKFIDMNDWRNVRAIVEIYRQFFARNAQMWETGDAQRRQFNAALKMIAEGTNHPEAD